jgi:hypothetical protein
MLLMLRTPGAYGEHGCGPNQPICLSAPTALPYVGVAGIYWGGMPEGGASRASDDLEAHGARPNEQPLCVP